MPEGRAANQPLAATTFNPPIAASLPGARVSFAEIGSPASSVAVTASGESFLRRSFCSGVAGASMRANTVCRTRPSALGNGRRGPYRSAP